MESEGIRSRNLNPSMDNATIRMKRKGLAEWCYDKGDERYEGNSHPEIEVNFRDENSLRGEDCNARKKTYMLIIGIKSIKCTVNTV